MRKKLEKNIEKKIRDILKRNGFFPENIEILLSKLESRKKKKEFIPPTAHVSCTRNGKRYHGRFLMWDDPEWRKIRKGCIQTQIKLSKIKRDTSFRVPNIVSYGFKPIVWDISEFAEGKQIPWDNRSYYKLNDYIKYTDLFLKIIKSIWGLKTKGVKKTNLKEIILKSEKFVLKAFKRSLISEYEKKKYMDFLFSYRKKYLNKNTFVFSHGDYNPKNVIFPKKGLPFVLDWDHAKYSLHGDSLPRLWMFTSNEPMWQKNFETKIKKLLNSDILWNGFILFALFEVFKQCDHEFGVLFLKENADIHDLQRRDKKRHRVVKSYLKSLRRFTYINTVSTTRKK